MATKKKMPISKRFVLLFKKTPMTFKLMLRITGFILSAVCLFSCNQPSTKSEYKSVADSLIFAEKVHDKVNSSVKDYILKDTNKLSDAPVKVISAKPVTKEYSSYKDISLSYKNISGKTITAIRFSWYGLNAFNEPADMGVLDGYGKGSTDVALKNGKIGYGTWNVLSRDLKKVVKAWPTEVVFEDGTTWKIKGE